MPLGAPFFSRLGRGGLGRLELGIGPSLTQLPEGVHLPAKAPPGLHLAADEFGLRGREETGLSATGHRPGEAVVRPMALLGLLRTSTTGLAAFDVALEIGRASCRERV